MFKTTLKTTTFIDGKTVKESISTSEAFSEEVDDIFKEFNSAFSNFSMGTDKISEKTKNLFDKARKRTNQENSNPSKIEVYGVTKESALQEANKNFMFKLVKCYHSKDLDCFVAEMVRR